VIVLLLDYAEVEFDLSEQQRSGSTRSPVDILLEAQQTESFDIVTDALLAVT
jgi:hypothetical protein